MSKTKRIATSLAVVTLAVASFVAGTKAYFSDTEVSKDNVLAAGAIDLKIDNESYYNGEPSPTTTWELKDLDKELFFNFSDLKPGDWGEDTVSLHVDSNDAWACVDIALTANSDETCTEPELGDDTGCVVETNGAHGDLANELYFVFWADDGDNVLEEKETVLTQGYAKDVLNGVSWPIADSKSSIFVDKVLKGGQNYYIGKAWCFGEMKVTPVTPDVYDVHPVNMGVSCDGRGASNASQTDKVMGDITFRAVQARHNEDFVCVRQCVKEGEGWATSVVSYSPGPRRDGSPVPPPRNDSSRALGVENGEFTSLGFGGTIVLKLAGPVEGSEVTAIEVTWGREGYPDEDAEVYVSEDGINWTNVGTANNHDNGTGVSTFTVSNGVKYVKLFDVTDPTPFPPEGDGYDLDAVKAVVCLDGVKD